MADMLDHASEIEQLQRDAAIAEAVERANKSRMTPCLKCYNCEETIQPEQLFCDADCSADYELRQRAQRRV